MSPAKCPYLIVPARELDKVKVEFRNQVREDAEKCIEKECPAYIRGSCQRQGLSMIEIEIGSAGYNPPEESLV